MEVHKVEIVKQEGPIHLSNVRLVCNNNKPTSIKRDVTKEGKFYTSMQEMRRNYR